METAKKGDFLQALEHNSSLVLAAMQRAALLRIYIRDEWWHLTCLSLSSWFLQLFYLGAVGLESLVDLESRGHKRWRVATVTWKQNSVALYLIEKCQHNEIHRRGGETERQHNRRCFIISPSWPLGRRLWRIALPLSGSQPNSEIQIVSIQMSKEPFWFIYNGRRLG